MSIVKPVIRKGSGGVSIGDATAAQWDIKNGLIAYTAGGRVTGSGYFPAAMDFSGGGYYTGNYTSSGNKETFVGQFKRASFAGGTLERLCRTVDSIATQRCLITIASSDHATTTRRNKLNFSVNNSAAVQICDIYSDVDVTDDEWHHFFCEFDGDAGTAKLWIDGVDADDLSNPARTAPAVATLAAGASSQLRIASLTGAANAYGGLLRHLGYRDTAGLTLSNFIQTDGTPKNIESTLSTVWGATPPFWNESAYMQDNQGSAGNMTANGTITLAAASVWS